jgi:general stress protein 26
MTPGICSVLVAPPIQRAGAAASFKAIVAARYSKGPSLPRRLHYVEIVHVRQTPQEIGAVEQMSKATGAGVPEPEGRPMPMNKNHEDNLDRVIIAKVGVTMLTTQFSGGLRARPLEARPDRDAGLIWSVTDVRSGKEHEIEAEHHVCLVFIDAAAKAYLSITARAEVRHDHAKAAEIWKSTDNMWWNGPDDPNVCVLRVRPVTAELWDGPANPAVAAFEFAKARITGAKPNLGENRKVTVKM